MHRYMNGACMFGYGPADGLANPPCGIGAKTKAPCWIELLGGPNQAQIAFLHQIEQKNTLVVVAFGDADDQTQVCLDQLLLCLYITIGDTSRNGHLLLCCQQRITSNLA